MIGWIKEKIARKAVDVYWWQQNRSKLHTLLKNSGQLGKARYQSCEQFSFESQKGPSVAFIAGNGARLQISVLEDWLLHIRLLPDGQPRLDRTWSVCQPDKDVPFKGRKRDNYQGFSRPQYSCNTSATEAIINTPLLRVSIDLTRGSLRVTDPEGTVLVEDTPQEAMARDTKTSRIRHRTMLRDNELLMGFGEKSGRLIKNGRHLRMMDVDVMGYNARTQDPLYKNIPFYLRVSPDRKNICGIFYDNLSVSVFDAGRSQRDRLEWQAVDGDLDYYVIAGPSMDEVCRRFASLTGRIVLPPRYSLGYLGSTMTYTELPDAQVQLRRFAELCREHDIPCDLFHLSSGFTSGANNKRYVFEWNRSKVPSPQKMVDDFHAAGIKLTANIKPCMLTTHPRYQEAAKQNLFITNADGTPHVTPFWGGEGSYLDFTNPATVNWWKQNIKKSLLRYAIDSTWNDNNEVEIWDASCRCHGFGTPLSIEHLRPVQTMLMTRASFEAQQQHSPDLRPYLICRSGCAGIQRYAQSWTGDNFTSWESLKYNVPMALNMSLCGLPNTGHDVGGFFGFKPSPELFVRWVQSGILHPRFTIHSWHLDKSVNEPWMFPEVTEIIRDTIRLRYRLQPFLYSVLFECARTGRPMIRPLCYEFADDEQCWQESFDYLYGSHLLVAGVYRKGQRRRTVYLPAGADWTDYYTGTIYEGGRRITIEAPLPRIPLLVRGGGILPLEAGIRHAGQSESGERELALFPGRENKATFSLFEDDGLSMNYARGQYTKLDCTLHSNANQLDLQLTRQGRYRLPYTTIRIILPPNETRPLKSNLPLTKSETVNGQQVYLAELSPKRKRA